MERYRMQWAGLALGLLLLLGPSGCGDDDSNNGGPTVDTTRPRVTAVDPAPGATGIDVDTQVTVTFSEDIDLDSVSGQSITLDDGVPLRAGAADKAGTRELVFTPAEPLDYSTTYEVTVDSALADEAGNTLAADYVWSFSTAEPPLGSIHFPLQQGNVWLYESTSSATVWTGTGTSTSEFEGLRVLYAQEPVTHQGRDGWLIRDFTMDETLTAASALDQDWFYLASDAYGTYKADPDRSSGAWENLIVVGAAEFDNSGFLLAGGPAHSDGTDQTSVQFDGQLGTYWTVRCEHDYTRTGQYATEDIFETRREYFADGLGLLYSFWDYDYDDNDPSGFDYYIDGSAELIDVVNGPLTPRMVLEDEPNNDPSPAAAQVLETFCVLIADAQISDAGTILTEGDVGCISGCLNANIDGENLFQDFYRFEVTVEDQYRFDMIYDDFDPDNDLDLYIYEVLEDGSLWWLARADASALEPEWMILFNLVPGTYCLSVQAWSTPTPETPVEYALSIRPQAVYVEPPKSGAAYLASGGRK